MVPYGDSTVYFSSIGDRHLRYPGSCEDLHHPTKVLFLAHSRPFSGPFYKANPIELRGTVSGAFRNNTVLDVAARNLNVKAKFESSSSYFSFKRFAPSAFNVGFIGATSTALPRRS